MRAMRFQAVSLFHFALVSAAVLLNSNNTHADTVYVWSNDDTIKRFDASGVYSLVLVSDLEVGANGHAGLALDNVGNLYVGAPAHSSIFRFSPDGTSSMIGYIDSVSGLAFDNAGVLYVTSPNWTGIGRPYWGPGYGLKVSTNTYATTNLSYPLNLCFDSAGTIYVANADYPPGMYPANSIENFSTNFTYLGSFATNLNNPWGLAFDDGGNLFVSNSGTNGTLSNTILRFTKDGVASTFANASNGLNSPRGLAFDSVGNLYVANYGNGTIDKFTPNGISSVFASGLNGPTSIAIFPGLHLWSAQPIKLANPKTQLNRSFQFDLVGNPGLAFKVMSTTNASLPMSDWAMIGSATETTPGLYQFADPLATNGVKCFYRVLGR